MPIQRQPPVITCACKIPTTQNIEQFWHQNILSHSPAVDTGTIYALPPIHCITNSEQNQIFSSHPFKSQIYGILVKSFWFGSILKKYYIVQRIHGSIDFIVEQRLDAETKIIVDVLLESLTIQDKLHDSRVNCGRKEAGWVDVEPFNHPIKTMYFI